MNSTKSSFSEAHCCKTDDNSDPNDFYVEAKGDMQSFSLAR